MDRKFSVASPLVQRIMCTAESVLTSLKGRKEISLFEVSPIKRKHDVIGVSIQMIREKDGKKFENQLNLREVKDFKAMRSHFRSILEESNNSEIMKVAIDEGGEG